MGGSSGESWTMGASLIQPCRMGDEGYFGRKALSEKQDTAMVFHI